MKIQAINVNFKGLFTDRSKENKGNWKMEYSPYSWERAGRGCEAPFKMADQESFSTLDTCLPDNEKIYVSENVNHYNKTGQEYCTDILGTKFYYCDFDKNILRNRITEVPAMNLEDSLLTQTKKLNVFMEMQKEKLAEFKNEFKKHADELNKANNNFFEYSWDYDKGLFERDRNRDENKNGMANSHRRYRDTVNSAKGTFEEYAHLRNSIDSVNAKIIDNQKELNILQEARLTGNLIDISRRDIEDPNKLLWQALQNVKEASGKIIALPHKTLAVKELLKQLGSNLKSSEVADKAVRVIDNLIRSKI